MEQDHRITYLARQIISLRTHLRQRPWLRESLVGVGDGELTQLLAADEGLEDLLTIFGSPVTPPEGRRDEVWIGKNYERERVLVLGESWYGDYGESRNTDRGYVDAYVNGRQADGMYTKMANACGLSPNDYWQAIAFTNFAQWVGDRREDRPTRVAYEAAAPRLGTLLASLKPRGVWILGREQAAYSAPVIQAAGIPFTVTRHPTSYGLTSRELGDSWNQLKAAMQAKG